MSFVFVEPQILAQITANLSGIGSALVEANSTAVASTTGVVAAAADEVSVQIAALFNDNAVGYHQVSAQAAAYYEQFVRTTSAGASAYAAAEATAAQALGGALAAPAATVADLQASIGINLANAELLFNQALANAQLNLQLALNVGLDLNAFATFGNQLAANIGIFGNQLAANVATSLNANLNGLVQTGAAFFGNLGAGLPGLSFPGLSFPGLGLPGLAAELAADIQAGLAGFPGSIGVGFPGLVAGINAGLGAFNTQLNAIVQTGAAFFGNLGAGLPGLSFPGLSLPGLADDLAATIQAGLNGLGGGLALDFPALVGNINAGIGAFNTSVNAALNGALGGNLSGTVNLVNFLSGLPTAAVGQFFDAQAGVLAGLVDAQLALNANLVAGETALINALFGVNTSLGTGVGYGFNAANLLLGTGQQIINTFLGAPVPTNFTSSLIIGGAVDGVIPTGGLVGALNQLLLANAALGGVPLFDLSAAANLNAEILAAQLAFNENLVANEIALQVALFGTANPLLGAFNNFSNIFNLGIGTGQQLVNAFLGITVPSDFYGNLILGGTGDVFGGITTGGLLGAVQQKFLFDGAIIASLLSPFQGAINTVVDVNGGGEVDTGGGSGSPPSGGPPPSDIPPSGGPPPSGSPPSGGPPPSGSPPSGGPPPSDIPPSGPPPSGIPPSGGPPSDIPPVATPPSGGLIRR